MNTHEDRSGGVWIEQQQGAWVVRMWWPGSERPTGGPQRMEIHPAAHATAGEVTRGISTTVLRRLDLAGALAEARESQAFDFVGGDPSEEGRDGADLQDWSELATAAANVLLAQEGASPRYLAVLSAAYSATAAAGYSAPVPRLAEVVGRPVETIKSQLKKARREGLLTSLPGKTGGEISAKAQEILKEIDFAPYQSALEDWHQRQAEQATEKGQLHQ
ncbi:hypothetical protein [Streptomyces hundungensis]|uniref:hypothetical protein n=1 Tax=Streptomyces hundungensis TaxID=1077946 RepID=UPI003403838F